MKITTLWLATEKCGSTYAYSQKPKRAKVNWGSETGFCLNAYDFWALTKMPFPTFPRWEDEPKEIRLFTAFEEEHEDCGIKESPTLPRCIRPSRAARDLLRDGQDGPDVLSVRTALTAVQLAERDIALQMAGIRFAPDVETIIVDGEIKFTKIP